MEANTTEEKPCSELPRIELSWEERFVSGLIDRYQKNKGDAAKLRRADNPATEYQCWELLAYYGVNLEKQWVRLPFICVAAAMAREQALKANGTCTLGVALASCYEDKQGSDQAKVKLRRLLACDDTTELVRHLRPVLKLIQSRSKTTLDYIRLLKQLRQFARYPQRIKAQWAQEFYGQVACEHEQGEA